MGRKDITARVPEDLYEAIETIQAAEESDHSTVIEQLLQRGVEDWLLEIAVRRYRDGELSLGVAANFADVSIWRLLDVLEERDIEVNYSAVDLAGDLAATENR